MVVTDSFSNQFRGSVRGGADPRVSGGLSMASATRDRVRQDNSPLVLNGPAGRRLPLRILFIHSNAADV